METGKLNIKQWAEEDRPREKSMQQGMAALSVAELLAILIGSGSSKETAVALMQRILASCEGKIAILSERSVQELCEFHGIGPAKAITIKAAAELANRRLQEGPKERCKITSSNDIYELFHAQLRDLTIEECWAVLLNQGNRIIEKVRISGGGITATAVDLRIVLREALLHHATGIALVHNHPSGTSRPSGDDDRLTSRLAEAAKIMEIRLLDHLVICDGSYYSYADEGKLS